MAGNSRKHGNSAMLCQEFECGAKDAGNNVELIYLRDKKIGYCLSCHYCKNHDGASIIKANMAEVLAKMNAAEGIVMASPGYFHAPDAKMKALIDRKVAPWLKIRGKTFYYMMIAAEDTDTVVDCAPICAARPVA